MEATATTESQQEFDMPDLCRSIAESSPMPIAAVETAGSIVRYVNPAFCRLIGKTREELIGNAFSLIAPRDNECLSLLNRVYQTKQAQIHTGQEESVSPPLYWSYAMWPVLAADGRIFGVMFQVTETTHCHQQVIAMNQALMIASVRQHELTEEAEMLNERLRRANEDLKQFAFAAGHDLQEPLRIITNYSQLLVKGYPGQLDGEAAICVDFITKGAKHMRDLLT